MPTLGANQKPSKPGYHSTGPYLMHSTFQKNKLAQVQHWDNRMYPASGCSAQSTGKTSLPLPTIYQDAWPQQCHVLSIANAGTTVRDTLHYKGYARDFNSLDAFFLVMTHPSGKKIGGKYSFFFLSCFVPYTIKHVTNWNRNFKRWWNF